MLIFFVQYFCVRSFLCSVIIFLVLSINFYANLFNFLNKDIINFKSILEQKINSEIKKIENINENLDLQEKMFETVAQYSTETNYGALTAMMEQGNDAFQG